MTDRKAGDYVLHYLKRKTDVERLAEALNGEAGAYAQLGNKELHTAIRKAAEKCNYDADFELTDEMKQEFIKL